MEEVALRIVAAQLAQYGRRLLVLDALGDAAKAEGAGQIDDRSSDHLVGSVGGEVADKRLIDLERRDGQSVEVRERGLAGAEVVDRNIEAMITQTADEAHAGVE